MKRLSSSSGDSVGGLISMCPVSEEHSPRSSKLMYQSMLGGIDEDESGHTMEKKRRLSVDQVKALEKNFEVENKLEPERKMKLAQDLGLQPRQVAVWFQNRRARWKTKQLERDYGLLKSNFDNLKHNYDCLLHDKDSLLNQIKELNSKLNEENTESNIFVKEEALMCDSDKNTEAIEPITPNGGSEDAKLISTDKGVVDGSWESDSSAIVNSPNASNSSCGGGFPQNQQQLVPSSSHSALLGFNCSSIKCFSFTDYKSGCLEMSHNNNNNNNNSDNNEYEAQYVKLEEHNFLSGEEACNFFSDEAAPTLHWYTPDQWP
ncbi:hypothetical protein RND81_13G218300 [Saponaria officinalis]|uniref:Homeobox-leucine zipper protein n=1 Tax=Saponaria officinalis TaxID=3572 RepID=A0AAW1H2T7_SAPOF